MRDVRRDAGVGGTVDGSARAGDGDGLDVIEGGKTSLFVDDIELERECALRYSSGRGE